MSEENREPTAEEKQSTLLLGLVLSLRSMALDLLGKSQVEEARGLVDTIEALDAKTKGNLAAEEAKVFEQVLYELRLAVVSARSEPPPSSGTEAEEKKEPKGERNKARPKGDGLEDGS